ncbi:MAG: leucyl/phenylalanyl-tRNA--protein transferase [Acidobacteriota bacterium]|jgi:leucyl/phenylalanyl-tRNA--protein transferase|nr:leucyl/phenylalanyl-tRNA--protein transferase [Acidobacteriota bacterium]
MPVFRLNQEIEFPPVRLASPQGLLAVGGDLSVERILEAYSRGIFPWSCAQEPLLWWSPDPRMVLFPDELHISRRMERILRKKPFSLSLDRAFARVVTACAQPRADGLGTWITADLQQAFVRLHQQGYAHSLEIWRDEELAGGIYGLSLGGCFFGESMFSAVPNASRYGLIHLVRWLGARGFSIIDCQVETGHLQSFGARAIPREVFLRHLQHCLKQPGLTGNWSRFSHPLPAPGGEAIDFYSW